MDKTVVMSVLKHFLRITSVAATTSLAVNDHLYINADRSLGAETIENVETIG